MIESIVRRRSSRARQWLFARFGRAALVTALLCPSVGAHHSSALFYDVDASITITGIVEEFRFHNPHAIVILSVENEEGETERWTAETTSPSVLRRRGWSQDSMKVGEAVSLTGIPSSMDRC